MRSGPVTASVARKLWRRIMVVVIELPALGLTRSQVGHSHFTSGRGARPAADDLARWGLTATPSPRTVVKGSGELGMSRGRSGDGLGLDRGWSRVGAVPRVRVEDEVARAFTRPV